MGICPQLQHVVLHSLWNGFLLPIKHSRVAELTTLTRLQHLELEECVLVLYSASPGVGTCKLAPCLLCLAGPKCAKPLSMSDLWVYKLVFNYVGGGPRYQGGAGFSEFLLFEGLQSLKLDLHEPPQRLYFADGFSNLTALQTVELRSRFGDTPMFSALSLRNPLEVPTLQWCAQPEVYMSSHLCDVPCIQVAILDTYPL